MILAVQFPIGDTREVISGPQRDLIIDSVVTHFDLVKK